MRFFENLEKYFDFFQYEILLEIKNFENFQIFKISFFFDFQWDFILKKIEVFFKIFKKSQKFSDKSNFSTFLYVLIFFFAKCFRIMSQTSKVGTETPLIERRHVLSGPK